MYFKNSLKLTKLKTKNKSQNKINPNYNEITTNTNTAMDKCFENDYVLVLTKFAASVVFNLCARCYTEIQLQSFHKCQIFLIDNT